MQEFDTINAELAREWQATRKAEVLQELQTAAQAASAWVRGLTNEQLKRSGQYAIAWPPRTVEDYIERALIGHIAMHTDDIRSALDA